MKYLNLSHMCSYHIQYLAYTHIPPHNWPSLHSYSPPPNQSTTLDDMYDHRIVLGFQKIVPMQGQVMWPYTCNERYEFQIICCARKRSWDDMSCGHLLARLILHYNLTTNYLSMYKSCLLVLDHLIDFEAWFVGDFFNEQGRASSFW